MSGLTSRRSQPPSLPAFVFRMPRVGGGSALVVRPHYTPHMKQISASIIVLAAAIVIVGSSHFDGRGAPVIFGIGIGVCVVGLRGWFISMKEK